MNQLYRKNELIFSIIWIVVYVVGLSLADQLSASLGVEKLITVIACMIMTGILINWMKRNDLFKEYGLCKSQIEAKRLLYYIPLVFMASINLWFGISLNLSLLETIFYIISMLFVGFLEEIIFRGLLFKAMCKDNVRTAIIVSSVTFGIGHIVNLFNGAEFIPTMMQIGYAISIGYLFVTIFYKSNSIIPCIIAHGVNNALSIFNVENEVSAYIAPIFLMVVPLIYAFYINKTVKEGDL